MSQVLLLVARTLQLIGLLYLPIGLIRGLQTADQRGEMVFLAAGAGMFLLGRWLQARVTRG
jgi:hypothetical protein